MKTLQIALFLTAMCTSAQALPKRILLLGDSNTNAGQYISYIETALRLHEAGPVPDLINLGLSSETCTGLSEPSHPFPRPNVHERIGRALEKVRPDAVIACYGMNDGIYHPFSEERFTAFQKGIQGIIDVCKKANLPLTLLTPPPFDPEPMRAAGKLVPADGQKFDWGAVYENYDAEVIGRYADWMLKNLEGTKVIDIYSPMKAHLAEVRKTQPGFAMSNDGVHFDDAGHKLLANIILQDWGYGKNAADVPEALFQLVHDRQMLLHNAWLSEVGHLRPGVQAGLPIVEALLKASEMEHAITLAKIDAATELAATAGAAFDQQILMRQFPKGETPVSLFNGKNLDGWDGWDEFWSVQGGMIRGANGEGVAVPSSTYLFTKKSYRNFRVILEVKQTMSAKHSTMHSALCALGERFADTGDNAHGFKGPLLMFCHDWGIWDAYRRNRTVPPGHQGTLVIPSEKKGDWNRVEFLVTGDRIRVAANGEQVFDFTDQADMLQPSPIGLQLHANNKPQEYHFRNIVISENPAAESALITLGKK